MSIHEITVNVAERGTDLLNSTQDSVAGHLWINEEGGDSWGFASKNRVLFGDGHVYDNDEDNYASSVYEVTFKLTDEQYASFKDFVTNPDENGFDTSTYNVLSHSCVDFVWKALSEAGIDTVTTTAGGFSYVDDFQGHVWPTKNIEDLKRIKNRDINDNPEKYNNESEESLGNYPPTTDAPKYNDSSSGSNSGTPSNPLVLDLNGDGIELVNANDKPVKFSLTDENFVIKTSWLSAEDGFLAWDKNQDGKINNLGELFGDNTQSGYEALALLDTNGDSHFNHLDEKFNELLIWQDKNTDGVSQTDELVSLTEAGIASIGLVSSQHDNALDTVEEDGEILETGEFVYTDGTTGQTADINLYAQASFSEYIGDFTLDEDVLAVANIKGYGTLPDLHIAMSLDDTLKSTVLTTLENGSLSDLVSAFDSVLNTWANTQDTTLEDLGLADWLSADENGVVAFNFNAEGNEAYGSTQFTVQQLAIIQAYAGADASEVVDPAAYHDHELRNWYDIGPAAHFDASWNELKRNLLAKFAVGNGLLTEHLPDVSYDVNTDLFTFGTETLEAREQRLDEVINVLVDSTSTDIINEQLIIALVLTESDDGLAALFTNKLSVALNEIPSLEAKLAGDMFELLGIGGSAADIISGESDKALFLSGNGGNDILLSHEHNDQLFGGAGDDYLAGRDGDDFLSGGDGVDTLQGGNGNDILEGGNGNDDLQGGKGDDRIFGQQGDDEIQGAGGDDIVYGGAGDDSINGDSQNDILHGEAGNDFVRGGLGNDVLYGGEGNDRIQTDAGEDQAYGGAGNDTIVARETSSLGLYGADYLDGGEGNDSVIYTGSVESIQLNLADQSLNAGAALNDTIVNVETIKATKHADVLTGDDNDNIFMGFGGGDIINGGLGNDTVSYQNFSESVGVNLLKNSNNSGVALGDQLTGIENLIGSRADDHLTGSHADNTLFGRSGDDFIAGGNGDDSLYGDVGNDELLGGHGNDTLSGGFGDDLLDGGNQSDILYGGEGNDQLIGGNDSDVLFGDAGNDVLEGGNQSDELFGGDGDDQLFGGNDIDYLEGGLGNDLLDGGNQDDTLIGGFGDDLLQGDNGNDTYQYALGDGNDIINDANGKNDSLILSQLTSEDIWFSRNDDNLTIGFAGNDGSITVTDWFDGKRHQIESIEVDDGSISVAQINLLVDAMAGFEPPTGSGNVISAEIQEELAPSLSKNWQKVA